MKRYRMTSCTSRQAIKYAEKVLPFLGKIKKVVAIRHTSPQTTRWREAGQIRKSTVTTDREYLVVYGENGSARIQGVCWGYNGEGPRAVQKILLLCGVDEDRAANLAFHSDRLKNDGISWMVEVNTNGQWRRAAVANLRM